MLINHSIEHHFILIFVFHPQTIFQIAPLNWEEWMAVLKLSLPVVFLDETLKYVSRKYFDGWFGSEPGQSTMAARAELLDAVPVLLMWAGYVALLRLHPLFSF